MCGGGLPNLVPCPRDSIGNYLGLLPSVRLTELLRPGCVTVDRSRDSPGYSTVSQSKASIIEFVHVLE